MKYTRPVVTESGDGQETPQTEVKTSQNKEVDTVKTETVRPWNLDELEARVDELLDGQIETMLCRPLRVAGRSLAVTIPHDTVKRGRLTPDTSIVFITYKNGQVRMRTRVDKKRAIG